MAQVKDVSPSDWPMNKAIKVSLLRIEVGWSRAVREILFLAGGPGKYKKGN